jgi:pSer/pThr/pTyr-binding forkhead associated (FHA) protein
MRVVLAAFRNGMERHSFSLVREATLIGRAWECHLRIPTSQVSRKHCRFIMEGQNLKVQDLGSTNGTFRNGRRVQEAALAPGDRVQVGPVTFIVQIDGQPPDEQLRPDVHPEPTSSADSTAGASPLDSSIAPAPTESENK